MTTNDSVNVSLSGQTGTGSFVGSDSPTFTTNISTPNLQFTANTITATNSGGSVIFAANGSGIFQLNGNTTAAATLRFLENSGNGTTYIALKAAESISSSVTFTLPTADGTNGQALTTDGSKNLSFTTITGGGSGLLTGVHYYTAGTTWNKPAGITHAYVLCLAGGGAGGSSPQPHFGAGGGGAGSYGWSYIAAASLSSTETVTIGPGGTPGAAGNHPGGDGGTTSFGSHITALGGKGGLAPSASTDGTPGAGGTCSGADINIPGNQGTKWGDAGGNSGPGGISPYGCPGAPIIQDRTANSDGNAATGYGAGGGGACASTVNHAGGAGAPGLCIVYEYT
jgi:Glycine-rich domain